MSGKSNIEWTELTWNPSTGCSKISEGCKFCYAENWARMQQKRGIEQYTEGFAFRLAPSRIRDPLGWKNHKLVFVNSMSDLFHEQMPIDYLNEVIEIIRITPQHTYQILTKRSDRLLSLRSKITWPKNVWLGVSVESNKHKYRIDALRKTQCTTKFISFEPLLEDIVDIDFKGIDWAIVGGESGGNARPVQKEWIVNIMAQCKNDNVSFFFKQWGKKEFNPDQNDATIDKEHPNHARGGCLINNRLYKEFPYGFTRKH